MAGNVMSGLTSSYASFHPTGNHYPATVADLAFTSQSGSDYRLSALSPYRTRATDGRDPGVDYVTLLARTGSAVQ
jgi:hypothetical protein